MNNTNAAVHAFRLKIRQIKQQYRHSDDLSRSLFNPAKGFVDAVPVAELEAALNELESDLKIEYIPKSKMPIFDGKWKLYPQDVRPENSLAVQLTRIMNVY